MAWVNGRRVGSGTSWRKLYKFRINVKPGKNYLKMKARNRGGPGAAIFAITQHWSACRGRVAKRILTVSKPRNTIVTSPAGRDTII